MTQESTPVRVTQPGEVVALAGRTLGASPWRTVTQETVDAFADAVGDRHWSHNDVDRAARGPFGTPIAHVHLTLGLVPPLFATLTRLPPGEDWIFYGYDRVRFPTAVPVGSRVRLHADVVDVVEISGAEQLVADLRVEVEGQDRPGCVARAVFRHYHVRAPD